MRGAARSPFPGVILTVPVDASALAKQFCDFYYAQFDQDRSQLGNLYRDHSMLTFEGAQVQGALAIVEKLALLAFSRVEHKVVSLDAQPASPNGDVLVMVTGALLVDEERNPMQYSQVFHLLPDNGSYYVFNDIFRLNFGG